MLPSIDERAEADDVVQRLDSTPKQTKSSTLPEIIGGHGPWQFRHWLVFFVASLCCSLHLFSVFPFSSATDCSCIRNASDVSNTKAFNSSASSIHQQFMEEKKACVYGAFLLTQQDPLYCPSVNLVIYAKCIYLLGILLSGFTAHLFTFKFGRRALSLTSGLFVLVSTVSIGWAQNTSTYLLVRFIISYGIMNVYLLSISSLRECVGEEYVLLYGLTGHIGWGIAHFMIPLVVWLAGNWLSFSLSVSCISFLLFIFICFIPESVDAYLSKGLNARAQKVIRKAAWSNGYPTCDVEHFAQNLNHQKTQDDTKIFCKQGNFRRYFEMCLRFLIGFSASFLYFVSVWLTDWRQVDRGAYFALSATTEIASILVLLFLTCFLSPKHLWSVATVLASVSLLLMYAKSSDESPIPTPPYLLTMFFSSVAYTLILLKTLFSPFTTTASKWNAVISGTALCIGALAASLNDLQKFHDWNPKLLVIFGIPNLTLGTSIAVIPNRFFTL